MKTRSTLKKQIARVYQNNIQIERLIEFCLIFLILCHNLSCIWFLTSKLQEFGSETWVARYDYEDKSIQQQYLAGLYFIITTITTVGYGDIHSMTCV